MLIGDSLTAGNLGIPYYRYLKLPPAGRIVNHGKDGDTLQGVLSRIEKALIDDKPDAVVLEIGANDILLPQMTVRGASWAPFVKEMISTGAAPTPDPDEFEALYTRLIRKAANTVPGRIVATTIPSIGENLESDWNRIREDLNHRIRRVATVAGKTNPAVYLADTADAFEKALRMKKNRSDWFFSDPKDFIIDARRIRREKSAAALSAERGLHLTMDGAHFNERGAELFAGVVSHALATGC